MEASKLIIVYKNKLEAGVSKSASKMWLGSQKFWKSRTGFSNNRVELHVPGLR